MSNIGDCFVSLEISQKVFKDAMGAARGTEVANNESRVMFALKAGTLRYSKPAIQLDDHFDGTSILVTSFSECASFAVEMFAEVVNQMANSRYEVWGDWAPIRLPMGFLKCEPDDETEIEYLTEPITSKIEEVKWGTSMMMSQELKNDIANWEGMRPEFEKYIDNCMMGWMREVEGSFLYGPKVTREERVLTEFRRNPHYADERKAWPTCIGFDLASGDQRGKMLFGGVVLEGPARYWSLD